MSAEQKDSAITGAIRQGRFLSWGGPLLITVTSDLLAGLYTALAAREDDPTDALQQIGLEWGRRWLAQTAERAGQLGASLSELALEDVQRLLQDDLTRAGWGGPAFDVESFAEAGIIQITVVGGPAAALEGPMADGIATLQAGFFAGVFGALTELPMAGHGVRAEAGPVAGAVIAVAQQAQIERLRAHLARGAGWLDALSGPLEEKERRPHHRRSIRLGRVRERR